MHALLLAKATVAMFGFLRAAKHDSKALATSRSSVETEDGPKANGNTGEIKTGSEILFRGEALF
jgi:hypothetical protein